MEEDNIKDLFASFDPQLPSSDSFMSRLEDQLKAVELIHAENERTLRRNRQAVVVASIIGFISGFLFSSFLPELERLLSELRISLSASIPFFDEYAVFDSALAWTIVGAGSVLVAVNSYEWILNIQFLKTRD